MGAALYVLAVLIVGGTASVTILVIGSVLDTFRQQRKDTL